MASEAPVPSSDNVDVVTEKPVPRSVFKMCTPNILRAKHLTIMLLWEFYVFQSSGLL